ncbi:hypothetical protein J5N97_018059 [Dioscorea zingiberensis]|uniref:adenylate dimethylallyltransferase (ADP/ATP-dependent) n=1 Tax=Dioscorea zingiberensis TaxID=325984 RepID=A0A9D5CN51_9LILI|nr:hypothetical protein J5N97_018059 [Dioscorea zingiberensis]
MMMVCFPRQVCRPRSCRPPSTSGCRQAHQPTFNFLPMTSFQFGAGSKKNKVVFVMGASGTGKSRLGMDLALRFHGEVVNSDKMQVYDGLDVVTNKVSTEERAAVPHHLIGGVHPDADFTAADFRRAAILAIDGILSRGRVPIVAGGSNSFIEELVDGENQAFRAKYECCFLWVDVDLTLLHEFVKDRVDRMVEMGMVDEVRAVLVPDADSADCNRGIRRSIGVPEMKEYFIAESSGADSETLARKLSQAIEDVKVHTCTLTCGQVFKIRRLKLECGWDIHRVDASKVFDGSSSWEETVVNPSVELVHSFIFGDEAEEKSAHATAAVELVGAAT